MHYRKKRSRDIALKGQSCVKKLRGEEGIKVEETLESFVHKDLSVIDDEDLFITQDSFRHGNSDEEEQNSVKSNDMKESLDEQVVKPDVVPCVEKTTETNAPFQRKKKQSFTDEEDQMLHRAIKCHGFGRWTNILRDPAFALLQSRPIDSIKKRAISKTFQSKFSCNK